MGSQIIRTAPQPGMLRNRQQNASARHTGLPQFTQHSLIFANVFEDIVGADHIELIPEGDMPCVDPQQRHVWGSGVPDLSIGLARHMDALSQRVGRDDAPCGERLCDGANDETCAASDLEITAGLRKPAGQRVQNNPLARTKPEMAGFQTGQDGQVIGFVVYCCWHKRKFYRDGGLAQATAFSKPPM